MKLYGLLTGCTAVMLACTALPAAAQQLKLGTTPTVINRSALLELESAKQGLLLPRITDTLQSSMMTAPDGMVIFLVSDRSFRVRSNGYWAKAGTAASGTFVDVSRKLAIIPGSGVRNVLPAGPQTLAADINWTINIDSSKAIWNANKLQSREIFDSLPGSGDVLKWNPVRKLWLPAQDITGGASYETLTTRDITRATSLDDNFRMKIWSGPNPNAGFPASGPPINGPSGTYAWAWSVLAFKASDYVTQLFFDKNTLALREWKIEPTGLTAINGNPWYKMVMTNGANSFTDGGIIFAGKSSDASTEVREDHSNLNWNNTNKSLGIRTTASDPDIALQVKGDFVMGDGSATLSRFLKGVATMPAGTAIGARAQRIITATVTGAVVNGVVMVSPRANMGGTTATGGMNPIVAWSRVSAANTVTICIANPNTAAFTFNNALDFDVLVIQ